MVKVDRLFHCLCFVTALPVEKVVENASFSTGNLYLVNFYSRRSNLYHLSHTNLPYLVLIASQGTSEGLREQGGGEKILSLALGSTEFFHKI